MLSLFSPKGYCYFICFPSSGKSLGIGVDDGTGTIWVHTVYCNGNERRLVDCRINFNKFDGGINFYKFDGSRSYCRHNRDVGIECFSAYEGHVRIKSSGGLEIFHDNEWGAVCKEDFDDTDASVACRQLGYRYAAIFPLRKHVSMSPLTLSIF
ncbi:unnamed protein product [Mytilus edulis]|uniref:SRCR domain-containing protein n=1 Tax=Mytilus edulis TaxID=6550 RepID=A0A8S3R7L6_MYTED|nr:unnamed protein product [Mytilus edulis]